MLKFFTGLWEKRLRQHDEQGMTMLEALVSVGILGIVVMTMIFAMSGGALAVRENREEVTVQNLARNQMEYIKDLPYVAGATTYPTISTPSDYSITIAVTSILGTSEDVQKVTANISRNSVLLMTISDYKVNR